MLVAFLFRVATLYRCLVDEAVTLAARPSLRVAAPGRRRGATIIEYMLLALFGVIIFGLIYTVLRQPISNVIDQIKAGLTRT